MLEISERRIIERIVSKDGLKLAFIVWLIARVALSAWAFLILLIAPPSDNPAIFVRHPSAVLPSHDLWGYLLGVWGVFDTPHYITIAQRGYSSDPDYLTAFFPGFPLLIRIAQIFVGNWLLASIVVANICALIFFWYLYRLVEADYGAAVAKRAVILSAIFPTSFFLFMGYTEAPLLCFTVMALYYGRQHKWWLAGVLAGCAALTKQPGILLFIPLAYMYFRQYLHFKFTWSVFKKLEWTWLFLCPLAAVSYTAYRDFFAGAIVGGVSDLGASEILLFPGMPLVNALRAITPDNPLLAANIMEIGFTVLMIGLVAALILKIRSIMYSLYSVALLLVSLSVTWPDTARPEADIPRRLLIIFPIFIYLALVTAKPSHFRYLVYASSALFLAFTGLFVNWVFVS
jgi:hypothetical protein